MSEGICKEVIIYARVSTWPQVKGHGLQRQIEKCLNEARIKGFEVVGIFSEVCSYKQRSYARDQAYKMARHRNATLLCESIDRWSRKGCCDLPDISRVAFVCGPACFGLSSVGRNE